MWLKTYRKRTVFICHFPLCCYSAVSLQIYKYSFVLLLVYNVLWLAEVNARDFYPLVDMPCIIPSLECWQNL